MNNTLLAFKEFLLDEEMDPTLDKTVSANAEGETAQNKNRDYFQALGDEQGIEWENLVKTFENEPWVSAHFPLGKPGKEIMYKLTAWEIVPGTLSPNGCDIRLKHGKANRAYLKGNRLLKGDYKDDKRYHLNREQLMQFLTTGWTPATAQATGGMGGGII
jgi:hypothetical protein